jgi:hypothetical protein
MVLTPTTKNTPANNAAGMTCSTVNSGPAIVPQIAIPIKKWLTLCSTTAVASTTGFLISPPSFVSVISSLVSYTVKESV